ncbi:MAG: hypothetical protein HYT47_00125 [Candidatus Vogelbacteria bacterium]|nr:hypothetical protein [Candidatus Vogelbacteria bacterium]
MEELFSQAPVKPKSLVKIGWRWSILVLVLVLSVFPFLYGKLLNCIWYAGEMADYPLLYSLDNFLGDEISPEFVLVIVLLGLAYSLFVGFRKRFGAKRFIFLAVGLIGFLLLFLILLNSGTARLKSSRASTLANTAAMRAEAELYFNPDRGYGLSVAGNCAAASSIFTSFNPGLGPLLSAVRTNSSSQTCYATPDSWAVSVELPRGRPVGLLCPVTSNNFWCVDSTGNSFEISRHITGTSCEGLRVFQAGERLSP